MRMLAENQEAERHQPDGEAERGEMQARSPGHPHGCRDGGDPYGQEAPVRGFAQDALPPRPHHDQHEACRQRRTRLQEHGRQQRPERPIEHRIGRAALHVVHLRDQHDAGAVGRDAPQHGGLREGIELAGEQVGRRAVAAPQRRQDQCQARELRHGGPVRRHEAHDGEAEQHGAEDRKNPGGPEGRRAGGKVGFDGGRAGVADPAGRLPAREIALHPLAVPGHPVPLLSRVRLRDIYAASPPDL